MSRITAARSSTLTLAGSARSMLRTCEAVRSSSNTTDLDPLVAAAPGETLEEAGADHRRRVRRRPLLDLAHHDHAAGGVDQPLELVEMLLHDASGRAAA